MDMAWLSKFRLLQRVPVHSTKKSHLIFAAVTGCSIIGSMCCKFSKNKTEVLDTYKEGSEYIYISPIKDIELPDCDDSHDSFMPLLSKSCHISEHWKLLDMSNTDDSRVREKAICKLASLSHLDDSQYRAIAQASNIKVAVGLARTSNASLKFFLPPPPDALFLRKEPLEYQFYQMLEALPKTDTNECVQYLTRHVSELPHFVNSKLDTADISDDFFYQYKRRPSAATRAKLFLEAALAHSTVPDHTRLMVVDGILHLLYWVHMRHPNDLEVKSLISKIIGNIALEGDLNSQIFAAGWVGMLASWSRLPMIQVSLPASKALANMDKQHEDNYEFADGLYLLHPQFLEDKSDPSLDIILVHGILGGLFRTWRQHDSKRISSGKGKTMANSFDRNAVLTEDVNEIEYTFCWPKDWLLRDLPYSRLIGIDYSSHVSEWKNRCPLDKEKRDLTTRAGETLKKLVDAGVGKRPVIFISHSMGGLLVKQMLIDAFSSNEDMFKAVAEKTVGVVFYAVPHRGSDAMRLWHGAELIFQPSVEIQQVRKGSSKLLKLHEEFQIFTEKHNIKCLSFGETRKSNVGLKWSAMLVPEDSANPGFGTYYKLETDHLNTCKPVNHESPSYDLLVNFLKNVLSPSLNISEQYKVEEFFWLHMFVGFDL